MPVTPELIQYVKDAQYAGMSDGEIIKALKDYGWEETILNVGLKTLQESEGFYDGESYLTPESVKEPRPNIIIEGIYKSFGSFEALKGVSLKVMPGTVTVLLGPNGAGKTTLIRVLTTLIPPTAGTAMVAGYDVVRDAGQLRHVIGLAGQNAAVDEILTGRENLELVGNLYHLSGEEVKSRAEELILKFDLADAADRQVATYSGGMRRRLDLAASLVGKPKILFLDEPTTGLDPRGRSELWEMIKELVSEGTTILLTTQYLEEADNLADFVAVIDRGEIIAQGAPNYLKAQLGGDVIEIFVQDRGQLKQAVQAVSGIGKGLPTVNEDEDKISVPVTGGSWALAPIVRRLDNAKIQVADIHLRRPTLDDVFLSLTGHIAHSPVEQKV